MLGNAEVSAQPFNLRTAFYDAMFDGTDVRMNPIEEQAAENVRKALNDPKNLSSSPAYHPE